MEGEVAVAVRDTGIGIAAETLPHIFEEFHQVDRGMTRRYEGAGLGLTIARRLAERMGGRLSAESQPGDGSPSRCTCRPPYRHRARRRRARQSVDFQTAARSG